MSLNKFTDIDEFNEWMNINCNEIRALLMDIENLITTDITADTLTVNTEADLKTKATIVGNVIPSAITTPGYVLSNSDGLGDCKWVAQPTLATTGTYSPAFSVVGGGSFTAQATPSTYSIVNDIVSTSGSLQVVSPNAGNVLDIRFNTPPGTTNNGASLCCIANASGAGLVSLLNFDFTITGSTVVDILMTKSDGTTFTAGQNYKVWYDITFKNQ